MTLRYQICAIIIMVVFYAVYIGKMLIQHEQGIQTDQIAKDTRNKKRYRIELLMKIATYSIVVVELLSIIKGQSILRYSGKNIGMIIGILGDFVFLTAVVTMSDSWRAGIAADDHRKLVNKGIFRISRNPAFVGFDLVYVGILIMFFNWFLMVITL
ncbi:MAG: methyltransferase family protein, partial [Lachnospiraceae bacterium]